MTALETIRSYYDAWQNKHGDMSGVPLADDFEFRGPVPSFDSAEGYRAMAREAGQAVTSFEVRRQFVDGDTVCSISSPNGQPCSPVLASGVSVASYIKLSAATVEPTPGHHPAASAYDKGIGQALGVGAFGLYQVELPPGCETVAHDHATDGAEDVYAVIRGAGTAVIDGEEIALVPGEFIAIQPESVRYVRGGADGLVFIAVCASARTRSTRHQGVN